MSRTETSPATGPAAENPSRWEWRTFAYEPDRWRAMLAGRQAEGGELLAQTCFVSHSALVDTKLRSRRIEVKLLGAVSPDGLELWHRKPAMAFPMAAADLGALLGLWGCAPRAGAGSAGDPEDLMGMVSRACPEVRAIAMRIWRRHYILGGCDVERSTLLSEGQMLESLRFSHEDPEVLRHALVRLALRPSLNTSAPRMLRQLIHWPDIEPAGGFINSSGILHEGLTTLPG